jgi:hypothetical protein
MEQNQQENALTYEKPILLDKPTTVKAIMISPGISPSGISTQEVKVYQWRGAAKVNPPDKGLHYDVFRIKTSIRIRYG